MGVPQHFRTSAENRTSVSYEDTYIQKIPTKAELASTYKPSPRFNATTERVNSYSERDRSYIHKRFQELFNNTYLLNSDFPWLSSTNFTYDYPSLYEIPLPTKIDFVIKRTPTWKYYISAPTILFIVLAVLKLFFSCQRLSNSEYFSRRRLSEERRRPSVLDTEPQPPDEVISPPAPTSSIIIESEFSNLNNSHFDLPPSYSQCAVDNIETNNKILDSTSEDLPPPYSTCITTLNDIDDMPKVHKRQNIEEQTRTATEIHLNNLHIMHRNNPEQSGSNISPLNRTVETAINDNEFNNLIPNNNEIGDANVAKIQTRLIS